MEAPSTLATSTLLRPPSPTPFPHDPRLQYAASSPFGVPDPRFRVAVDEGSTGKGILIGMLSAFGSAIFVGCLLALVYFLRFTQRGRILLDRVSRPGQYDDEQSFLREEAEALETMDDSSRMEYLRAKGSFRAVNLHGARSADKV